MNKQAKGKINILGIIMLMAVIGLGYYWFFYDNGSHNPFGSPTHSTENDNSDVNDVSDITGTDTNTNTGTNTNTNTNTDTTNTNTNTNPDTPVTNPTLPAFTKNSACYPNGLQGYKNPGCVVTINTDVVSGNFISSGQIYTLGSGKTCAKLGQNVATPTEGASQSAPQWYAIYQAPSVIYICTSSTNQYIVFSK